MSENRTQNPALLAMMQGKMTAEAQRLAQMNKAVIGDKRMGVPKQNGDGSPAPQQDGVEAREKDIPSHHFDIRPQSQQKTPGAKVDDGYIQALMEGKGGQYKAELKRPKPNPVEAAAALYDSIPAPATPTSTQIPQTAPVRQSLQESTSPKELLQEVVYNLRKGGILKEEIIKLVLEEVFTEQALVPIMEKHFRRMLKTFIQESKKA